MQCQTQLLLVRFLLLYLYSLGIEAIDFVRPISLGQIIEIEAHLVFTSSRSMDIRVDVFAESPTSGDSFLAVTANLVFVGLNDKQRAIQLRQMSIPTDSFGAEEYADAKQRHEARISKK